MNRRAAVLKKRILPVCLLLVSLFLHACAFPPQRVSPDPVPAQSSVNASYPSASSSDAASEPVPEAALSPVIGTPMLGLLWSAMADAHVFELREAMTAALQNAGITFREFDAENDVFSQLDQVETAVSHGCNILAVNLVDDRSSDTMKAILEVSGEIPVVFFDRVPEDDAALIPLQNTAVISVRPEDAGRVQGRMIGTWLTEHYSEADRNGDGQISYTMLLERSDDPTLLTFRRASIEEADAVLTSAGFPCLVYFDPDHSEGYQAGTGGELPSDAAHGLMSSDLLLNDASGSGGIELAAAASDEMALGALTALQAVWFNLGDGSSAVIPLFGCGGTAGARTAVSLGQMTGTVSWNADGTAQAVCAAVFGYAAGEDISALFLRLSSEQEDYSVSDENPTALSVMPLPFSY